MREYSVNEIFYSLQGEGYYTGTAAIFIRFAACNLRCPFCDTDFSRGSRMSAEAIVKACNELTRNKPLIVLTGGEPTLQVDTALCDTLHEAGYKTIAMETNGSNPVPAGVDFVTCSPKCDFVKEYPTIPAANEVKIVYDGQHNPAKWLQTIKADHYYLQPCDTGDPEKNREIINACINYIKFYPAWRLSLQTQKITNIR